MTTYRDPTLKYLATRISWIWTATVAQNVLGVHTEDEADELFERLKVLAKQGKVEQRTQYRSDGSSGSQWRLVRGPR